MLRMLTTSLTTWQAEGGAARGNLSETGDESAVEAMARRPSKDDEQCMTALSKGMMLKSTRTKGPIWSRQRLHTNADARE